MAKEEYRVFTNALIGSYSIGLSTLHRQPNSEIYRQWLRLNNPEKPNQVVGYLLVNCYILGPGMRQPVHDDKLAGGGGGFAQESDPEYLRMIKEGRTEEEILSLQKAKQGLSLLHAPTINLTAYQLIIKVFKAE